MASFGLRRAYGVLALLATVNWTVAQTTAPVDVVGYIVEDDAPFSSVTCELPDYQVYPNPDGFLFCDATTDYFLATDCVGGSTILYVTTDALESAAENTLTCSSACTSLTVVQEYPSGGSTWMIYDCLEYMGVPSGASVIYQTLPSGIPSTTTTTSEESTTTEEGTSTAENSRTTTTTTRSTQTNDPEDSGDSGPNVGVIVGATVGSVAGVALIIAAIFIGIRIGKKKSAAGAGGNGSPAADPNQPVQMVPPHMSMAGSPPLDKYGGSMYGGPPVVMAHPAQYPQPYMPYPQQQQQQQQPIVPQGYYPPQGYHPPEAYSPQPSQQTSSGPPQSTELPTGYAAQGWASGEDHPHPYEMEAMLQPGQRSPRPQ